MKSTEEVIDFLKNIIIECEPDEHCGRCDDVRKCIKYLEGLINKNCNIPVVVQHSELVCSKHNKKIALDVKVGRCVICGEPAMKAN